MRRPERVSLRRAINDAVDDAINNPVRVSPLHRKPVGVHAVLGDDISKLVQVQVRVAIPQHHLAVLGVHHLPPWGWENARAKLAGQPSVGAQQVACYTDALTLDGQAASGPYTAMVPLAFPDYRLERIGEPRLGLVIRIERHLRSDDPDEYIDDAWEQRGSTVAHGGAASEELAALLSLALGIRLRAGGIARVFHPSDDERGFPHQIDRSAPHLPQPARQRMLPYTMLRSVELGTAAALLDIYPQLPVKQARALVRAARSYQDALWIADSEPRLAWLRLVTATEAVARLSESGPAAQTLSVAHPEIAQLSDAADSELKRLVTEKLVDQSRATAKFLAFLQTYGPRRPRRATESTGTA